MEQKKSITIGIVGCGTVGGSTAQILLRDKRLLAERTGININLKYIIDLDFKYAEKIGLPKELFLKDLDLALNDPEISLFVELIGGTGIAKTLTEKILKSGKHVVTANKALLAYHGPELMEIARANGSTLSFEASCGGGIPLIRAFVDGLAANDIEAFYGIVNGTCNYILTSMINEGKTYEESLEQAREKGLAEADPTLDVSGGDSAHKLCILSSLAFGKRIDFASIPVQGIDKLSLDDVNYGRELGYAIKLLAIAQKINDKISVRVQPAFLHNSHPLAWVSGPFNAVSVYGSNVGHTMYYGRGAGGSPTASAVIADIISTAIGATDALFSTLRIWPDRNKKAEILSPDDISSRYYLRAIVNDKPGVLASIAKILAEKNISITSALQKEGPKKNEKATVVMTTHLALAGEMKIALQKISGLDTIESIVHIPIMDEHEENI